MSTCHTVVKGVFNLLFQTPKFLDFFEKWRKREKMKKGCGEYLLTYFLGGGGVENFFWGRGGQKNLGGRGVKNFWGGGGGLRNFCRRGWLRNFRGGGGDFFESGRELFQRGWDFFGRGWDFFTRGWDFLKMGWDLAWVRLFQWWLSYVWGGGGGKILLMF